MDMSCSRELYADSNGPGWSNGGHELRIENRLSFLDRYLHSSRESNEAFLGAANVISRPVICQVSNAGKHFMHPN